MNGTANYFKIGAFVIAGFFLFAGALAFFGAKNIFRQRLYLETYVDGTVQGVDVGSAVKFRGVPIGRISRIDFCFNQYGPRPDGERQDYVVLELQVDRPVFPGMFAADIRPVLDKAVAQGLRVLLQPQGITGLNYAELDYVPQPDRSPPLKIWWTPQNYYVPSAPGTVTSMLESVNNIMDTFNALDIKDTVGQLNTALGSFNEALKKIGGDLDSMQLAKVSSDLQGLLADLRAKVDKIPAEQLGQDGLKAVEAVRGAANDIRSLADAMESNPLLNKRAMGDIVSDLRATAENFRVLSESVRDRPSRLLFGAPAPRPSPEPARQGKSRP